jgi:hypothetical protein
MMKTHRVSIASILSGLVLSALLLAGCGGDGDDSSGSSGYRSRNFPIICPSEAWILIDGQCVNVFDNPDGLPPDDTDTSTDTSSLRPRLSASEPVLNSVTIDWVPPEQSWQGLNPPFIAGYVIYVSQPTAGYYQVVERITLDNPGLVTYVLDLPGSGRWRISVTAISTTGSESAHSNPVDIVIP